MTIQITILSCELNEILKRNPVKIKTTFYYEIFYDKDMQPFAWFFENFEILKKLQKKAIIEVLGAHCMLNINHRATYIFKSLISIKLSLK